MNVVQALSAVMQDVQSVRKDGRNQAQGFSFRGIDATINAVGPALRKHGVVVVPLAEQITAETYTTKQGTAMRNATLLVRFRFHGPEGDTLDAAAYGEASDAGDKAVSKAHSVAYRTVLLQALCIPTDEADPDSQAHERAVESAPDPSAIRARIAKLGQAKGLTPDEIAADFSNWSHGVSITLGETPMLTDYIVHLNGQPVTA